MSESTDEVLVVGQRPGPGTWKISKGGHVLWVFANSQQSPRAILRDVVPADGVGGDAGRERPIFAAATLYRAGLSSKDEVSKALFEPVKKYEVEVMHSDLVLEAAGPAKMLKEFKKGSIDDAACFAIALERLETDIDAMRVRANAWAKGGLDVIRKLGFSERGNACESHGNSAALRDALGLEGAQQRMRTLWPEAAENALFNNSTSFAMLKPDQLLKEGSVAAALQAKGYTVQAPD